MKYVSLHHHSTFSYMDGYGTPEQHVDRAVELGMGALALTEHGNITSHVRLEKAANKAGIKPLFGCELYTGPADMRETGNMRKWHLTALAENEVGYRNLLRIVSRSWAEGFYRWPTVTGNILADHAEGVVILSGCADSLLACDLFGGKGRPEREKADYETALRTVRKFQELFGDRYYIEAQQFPELSRTCSLNPIYAALSRETGVPLVATSDCHYPHPDDNKMQTILHAAGRGTGTVEAAEASWEYDIRMTPPSSDKFIRSRLLGTGLTGRQAAQALYSTEEIAQRCNVVLPKVDRLRYPMPDGETPQELVWKWLRDGWEYRIRTNNSMRKRKAEYGQRVKYEMELIEGKDFIDYFLMLSDAVRYAKDRGIPVGPARGSAAASLVCYLLRITEIDPLQFPNMLFERFIDINRTDLPDIDLDFDDERRDEIRQRLVEQYGDQCVGNIGTFTRYRGKNALIDVARVHKVPDYEIKVVKDLMVERSGGDSRFDASLEDTLSMFPQAQEVFDRFPELNAAKRLEGNFRGFSVHAAGLVVSNKPLTETVAMYAREDKKNKVMRKVLSVDKYDAEYLGLMKADFLGLTTMGMIRHALEIIGMSLEELYATPLDDEDVIDAFRLNDVVGVFQFGGGSTRIVNGNVAPDSFQELTDINALSRPGPLHSGATQEYIDTKHGKMTIQKVHPIYDRIGETTKGQIIYQEQILLLIKEIGGLPWAHIQEIRKVISLKKGEGAFNERYKDFVDGAKRLHNMDKDLADRIWKRLVTAGQYAFNVAHCVAYAMLAYWTMWLKVHHPQAFYAAALRKYPDEQFHLLRDALKHGIDVLPPDPNASGITWGIDKGTIRAGLSQVMGIGENIAKTIIDDREINGRFAGWEDLMRVRGIGVAKMTTIRDTAGSDDPFGIYKIDRKLEIVRAAIKSGEIPLPKPTYKADEIPTGSETVPVIFLGIPMTRDPRDVIEDERASTGEDYQVIKARMTRPDLNKRMTVHAIDDTDHTVFVRFNRYDFPKFEKALWDMKLGEDVILVQGLKRAGFGTSVYVKHMWVISPD